MIKAAKGVIVMKQLKEGIHVTPFGLKLLWRGGEDDFAGVDRGNLERADAGAEHFGDLRCQEVLKVVGDGFANAPRAARRLGEETIGEVRVNRSAARRGCRGTMGILKNGLLLDVDGQFVTISNKSIERISVCQARTIAVTTADPLLLKSNTEIWRKGHQRRAEKNGEKQSTPTAFITTLEVT